jgi:hypothetical protein
MLSRMENVPVPGAVLGNDVEGQADALADAAARLAELLTAFTQEPRRSLDAIAVFQALSRTAASMGAARPPSCAARSGSIWISMGRRIRRPRPHGTVPWRACAPPRARLNGSLPAGSE